MVRIEGCGDCKAARPHFFKAQKHFPSMNFITIEWEKYPESWPGSMNARK